MTEGVFLYDFWQFNKSSWQIKWLCWQLNCTANQYFQLLSLSFRKNTTWGHTVVKPRKENKTKSNWWGGGQRQGGCKLESTTQHHPRSWRDLGFPRQAWKMEPPLRDVLGLHREDFPLPMSYLKVIRFEPGMCDVLLGGPSLKHLPRDRHHGSHRSLERSSRTAGSRS